MHTNMIQPNKTNEKLLIGVIGSLLFIIALPSVFLLAKLATGLAMISIATIAVKITSKIISNALWQNDQDQDKNHITKNKVMNIAIGLASVFVGGISLLIVAKTGLIAACAAVTALALHECFRDEKIGKDVNLWFDEKAQSTTDFIIKGVEEFTSSKTPQTSETFVAV
ncbi:MAG: hypothetical protein PV340_02995 [Wolbachia sp.]|nr:hypothetical protein [Wolbachia sp.]MDD9336038.1 hypothetical protein [Wolbachia sp.]